MKGVCDGHVDLNTGIRLHAILAAEFEKDKCLAPTSGAKFVRASFPLNLNLWAAGILTSF